jgi:signal transduction histidine kinase/HAMP domain-containing protein
MRVKTSISRRLTLMNLLVSATALLLAGVAFFVYDHISFRQNIVRSVTSTAQLLASNTSSALVFNDPESAGQMLSALSNSPTVRGAVITRADGSVFVAFDSDARRTTELLASFPEIEPGQDTAHRFTSSELLLSRVVVLEGKRVGIVHLRASLALLKQRLNQYLRIVAAVLLVSLFVGFLVSSAYRRSVAAPIVHLAETARRVSEERDYSLRAPGPQADDEVGVLIGAFNDMLGQIEARSAELQQAHDRLALAQATAKLGEWRWDSASGVVTASEITREQHGMVSSVVPFATWLKTLDNDYAERVADGLRALAAAEGEREFQYRVGAGTSASRWVLLKVAHLGSEPELGTVRGVAMDITNLKRAEEALLRSEKLATAGRLAASISHEINNPLESVTNLLYLVATSQQLPPSLRAQLVLAEQELARVSHIATQTLRFYRQSSKPASVDVRALLDSLLVLLKARVREANVQLEQRYRDVELLRCFDGEIRQVFTNLISNALDAMPAQGGRLIIRISPCRIGPAGRPGLRVIVADNGAGMPPEVRSRIFEPFYSTKGSRGTGLGLWVTSEIVAKHAGRMRVRSAMGAGSVFAVTFPLDAVPADQVQAISA